jgi:2-hydroxycyclohexanecarboxyl-CoA dehydrogenase
LKSEVYVDVIHDPAKMALQGLESQVALVTGAARGIGRRVVETLQAQGAHVAACDLNAPEIPGALGLVMDVTQDESVEKGVATAARELGEIGVLVTSAGIFEECPFEDLTDEGWRRMIDVNLTGTFLSVRHTLPGMRRLGGGRIVTISSGAGIDGGSEACAHYAASKGGVIAFTKAIAKAYAGEGITANVVAPRAIRTPMIAGSEDSQIAPVGRIGEPEDVAAGVAFLCSAHASYVTGEVFVMNGGWW